MDHVLMEPPSSLSLATPGGAARQRPGEAGSAAVTGPVPSGTLNGTDL
jgi:hypothetical protein